MIRPGSIESCGVRFVGTAGFRKRAGESSARSLRAVLGIEGESLTIAQIAERLGVSSTVAEDRLRRERKRPGPVTWAALRVAGRASA